MSYGYSLRLVEMNKAANQELVGVQFGAVCMEHNVPVAEIADKFGVSRQTVYNWFCGLSSPNAKAATKIEKYTAKLEQ
jgi:transcriptional regulator with XRE-family HTH domain